MNCLKCENFWTIDIDESKCEKCHLCKREESEENG